MQEFIDHIRAQRHAAGHEARCEQPQTDHEKLEALAVYLWEKYEYIKGYKTIDDPTISDQQRALAEEVNARYRNVQEAINIIDDIGSRLQKWTSPDLQEIFETESVIHSFYEKAFIHFKPELDEMNTMYEALARESDD